MNECLHCEKKLRKYRWGDGYGYDGNGFFCTLRCGFYHAVIAAKHAQSVSRSIGRT